MTINEKPRPDDIAAYSASLTSAHTTVCERLRIEIDMALPKSTSKIWHGSPVWFIDGNPVVGYHSTARRGVNLLFWSGQLFDEPLLCAAGKFKAAQIQYNDAGEIDSVPLRRWLKKCRTIIWDYKNLCNPK